MLERIRAEGPLSALDFERERGATTDWFGMPTNAVRAVLEAYAVTGVLGLARRDGNRRYYDLLERLLPADVLARERPAEGATPAQAPVAVPRPRSARRRRRRRHLRRHRPCEAGSAVAGAIRAEPRYARSSSSAGSSFPSRSRACAASASSSARRSSCWKRRRSRRPRSHSSPRSIRWSGTAASSGACSSFDYVWELFFPPAKRRWGWYVLPMLFGDRLVGRIEPRDRPRRRPRGGARPLVGGRLRAAPRRGVRRRDARRAPRLPALRRRDPPRVGTAPRTGETTVSHAPLERLPAPDGGSPECASDASMFVKSALAVRSRVGGRGCGRGSA